MSVCRLVDCFVSVDVLFCVVRCGRYSSRVVVGFLEVYTLRNGVFFLILMNLILNIFFFLDSAGCRRRWEWGGRGGR